ncbi:MAG: flagellar basal-body rod protein FlgF [Candidatus Devosia phytovorans]|uniref:Flagellar basal-body rod protein FlgF n=1 Tax=Candidatus Devosia phytovorans TaxID=3121372 RepID=A0AAJ6B2N4_9HYPH|nr:flagellar basal-body rod protein FlgF [Devosia sp.]WEK06729.1 MAG: flagellar basal-body rod protein FlgF [Devosia sp.]
MENAQLIGLSRQMGLQRQMDVLANNMANINTSGFKSEQILFEEYVMPVARDQDFPRMDQPLSYVQDWATIHDLSGGAMVQTGSDLDVALNGDGFFAVETPAGERWTKAGNFQLSATGTLVDASGNPVLGDGGPIQFGPDETGILIGTDGSISSSAGQKGRLRVVEFANPETLTREGSNLWAGGEPQVAVNSRTMQGFIEKSNVSGVAEMAEMIRVTRAYESAANLAQKQDELRRSAIQTLGQANV